MLSFNISLCNILLWKLLFYLIFLDFQTVYLTRLRIKIKDGLRSCKVNKYQMGHEACLDSVSLWKNMTAQ